MVIFGILGVYSESGISGIITFSECTLWFFFLPIYILFFSTLSFYCLAAIRCPT